MTANTDEIVFSPTLIERFWKYVEVGSEQECWIWTGYTTRRKGGEPEGRISNRTKTCRRMLRVTRVSLGIHTGEWHEDQEACHTCENTLCVNPAHLYWGPHQQNMQDMVRRYGGVGSSRKFQ